MELFSEAKRQDCFWNQRSSRLFTTCLLAACLFAGAAHGHIFSLTDGNSSATVENDRIDAMSDWTVDGQKQLFMQSFWYRIGNSGGETPINGMPLFAANQPSANNASAVYQNSQLNIQVSYTLTGGAPGSGASTIHEQVTIKNISGASLNLAFFQFVDFDLNGSPGGDTAVLTGSVGAWTGAKQNKGTIRFAEVGVNPFANFGQVTAGDALINALKDGSPTTLNNLNGPVTGDAMIALEWTRLLASGASLTLIFDKSVSVPEPSAISLGLLGLIACGTRKCFRRRA